MKYEEMEELIKLSKKVLKTSAALMAYAVPRYPNLDDEFKTIAKTVMELDNLVRSVDYEN